MAPRRRGFLRPRRCPAPPPPRPLNRRAISRLASHLRASIAAGNDAEALTLLSRWPLNVRVRSVRIRNRTVHCNGGPRPGSYLRVYIMACTERPRYGADQRLRHAGTFERFRIEVPLSGVAALTEDRRRWPRSRDEEAGSGDEPHGSSSDGFRVEGSSRDSADG